MTDSRVSRKLPETGSQSSADILLMAAWFGLATGLSEGVLRTGLQRLGGVSWNLLMTAASVKLIWLAPLLYVVLFSIAGAFLVLAWHIAPRLPMLKIAVFLFGLVSFADLASSSGRVSTFGVGMLSLGVAVTLMLRARWRRSRRRGCGARR